MKIYCLRCRKKVESKDNCVRKTSNSRYQVKGFHPYCGTDLYVFIKESSVKSMVNKYGMCR